MALTVLLVDDSAVIRMVVMRALRQAGLNFGEYVEAGDGVAALATVESRKIDLVLCDWNMPNMNGVDFVAAARAKGHTMPILMVTTESGPDRVAQAKAAGANGLVTKPFTPERLKEELAPLLQPA